jgi:hypothetical protein
MKKARASCPQDGNNLWTEVHPPVAMDLARFAGPAPPPGGAPRVWKTPWAQPNALPVAGERRKRSSRRTARASGAGGSGLRESKPAGGFGKGASAHRRCRSLHPAAPRTRDRRCPSQAGWGIAIHRATLCDPRTYVMDGACAAKADLALTRGSSTGAAPQGCPRRLRDARGQPRA